MTEQDNGPGLQIDSDWKAQAQAEKDRLSEKEQQKLSSGDDQSGKLPEASFKTLVSMLASQAVMGLGAMGDQETGRIIIDLEGAKFSIDLLAVLQETTKGNIPKQDADDLTQVLVELRSRFVQIQDLIAKQAAAGQTVSASSIAGTIQPE